MGRLTKLAFVVLLLSVVPLVAEETDPIEPSDPIPGPQVFVTQHSGTFNGTPVEYVARAGETYLLDEDGKPKASIFSFAYTMAGDAESTTRPVMFIWNGGPGSASLWLHMGTFGRHAILRDRIEFTYYEAGHMMYVHGPSLEQFTSDVRRFILSQVH